MSGSALFLIGLAIAAGMLAQDVAARISMPSLALLLATRALLGPDLLGFFDPSVFGAARGVS